jgi:hypothetical protein
MAACNFDQCVFHEAPWTTGSSPVVTSRGSSPPMTSFFVVAMRLRIRALPRQETPSQESIPKKPPPLKEGRRSAERRTTGPHRQAMRRAPFLLSSHCGRTEAQDLPWTSKNGAGALAFRRPTAASEVFWASARLGPRFLEPPDANGRTLSGTSAASTSRSGTRRTGRCPSRPRAQCIATPTRTAPAPP